MSGERLDQRRRRIVAAWLFACAAAIVAMVVIGGITRLTESGLSIAEWRPLVGAIPPLSQAEWERVFALYREIPEYRHVNAGMSLDEFKTIFWWEYVHRLWGRLIGLIFFAPLAIFAMRRWLDSRLGLRLLGILALGGLQGAIGWWMVASGLVDRTDVSPYRLTVHLGVAFMILGLVLWTVLDLVGTRGRPARWGMPLLALVSITVVSGAFVAGNNAGLLYNTFPLMDGGLLPPDYLALGPTWQNAFENPAAVQFHHRVLAIGTLVAIAAVWWRARSRETVALLAAALTQAGLGIATLLLVVPIWLAALHQAGAVVLFSVAVWAAHRTRPAPLPLAATAEA